MVTTIKERALNISSGQSSNAVDISRYSSTQDRIAALSQLIFPLTKPSTDSQGNIIQLWSVPEAHVVGTLQRPGGSVRYIASGKIRNALNPEENTVSLHQRLLAASNCEWDYALMDNGSLIIWPHLSASGWRDALPKSSEDYRGLARLSRERTQEQMCAWFYSNGYKVTPPGKGRPPPEIEIHIGGTLIGKLRSTNDEGIRTLLRQGGVIKALHFAAPSVEEQTDNFIGRGLEFTHPKDQTQTTFNIDFTRVGGRAEEKGGYHIDVKGPRLQSKVRVSTRETYQANYAVRKEGKIPYYQLFPQGLGGQQKALKLRSNESPAMQAFQQKVQQTCLTDSYNATHRQNPILPKGATGGSIGGVACSTAYIEGLFESPEALFEEEHFFCVPGLPDRKLPFSNAQLRQILRELAIGVYAHSTIPFFSLHFNDRADQYPVIHPVYENTLVGRVISMLDYIMNGYLNGGVFAEDFIDNWHNDPDWKKKERAALAQLIDFQEYCERHHLEDYISLRDFQKIIETGSKNVLGRLGEAVGLKEQESDTLKNLKGFRNSFRIIAKQNSIRKEGNLFLIDADFDVLYTIVPSPEYKAALDVHMRKYGSLPSSYRNLERAYQAFCELIHDHMIKLPICRDYFAMLGVINFFSGYFSTLKKHRKVPVLPAMEIPLTKGAPPLFPYLPVREVRIETLRTNHQRLIAAVFEKHKTVMETYFWQMYGGFFTPAGKRVSPERNAFYGAIRSELQDQLIQSTSNARIVGPKVRNTREIQEVIDRSAKAITDTLEESELQLIHHMRGTLNTDTYGTYSKVSREIHEHFQNEWHDVMKFPLPQVRLLTDLKPLEIEMGEKIVGGCGMNLKQQAVRVCQITRQILLTYEARLKQMVPEAWAEIFYGPEKMQGFVFRLPYENVPVSFHDNYEWMESLLVPQGTDGALIQERLGIEKAIRERNKEDFIALVHPSRTLDTMRDRFQRTLMHHAACLQDSFYLDTLIANKMAVFSKDVHGYQPTHYAAMHGSVLGLELLVKTSGPEVLNARSRNGSTPLITAIQHGQLEVVRYLLSSEASFSVLLDGYNTLHCALHYGNLPIIYEVLASPQAPKWINQISKEGGTPLMLACELDSADLVKKMLSMGADPTPMRSDGVTAIEIGISRNCVAVVTALLRRASLTPQAIEIAAKQGSTEVLELLVVKALFYQYRNSYRDTTLLIAIRYGNINGALVIIQHSPEKSYLMAENNGRESAFSLAATLGAWELIKELDKKGVVDKGIIKSSLALLLRADYSFALGPMLDRCELNAQELEKFALLAAQVGNHQALSLEFFPRGVRREALIGPKGWTLAHYLAKSDGLFLFREIMSQEKDILLPLAEEGWKTLPYIASENKSLRVLRLSLQQMKQAGTRLERHFHDRHLFCAVVETGDLKCMQLFFNIFSDQKLELANVILDDTGIRAALLAAKVGSLKLLRLLVSEGANLKIEDRNGDNALCHALRAGASNVVSYLLEEHSATVMTSKALFTAAAEEDETFFIKMVGLNRSQRNLNHALLLAIQQYNTQAFLRLYRHGASLDYIAEDGSTCLTLAQATRQVNILRVLQPSVQEEMSPMTQLIAQIRSGKGITQAIRVIQSWLPNEIVQIEHKGELIWGTPLQLLLRILGKLAPEAEIAPLLRLPELDVNVQDSEGNTLVHLLLSAGILPTRLTRVNWGSVNHLGESLLHIAAKSEKPEILDSVLKQPVVVNARNHQGQTPLVYAIATGQMKNVELLLAKGADVNAYDIYLHTPLTLSYLGLRPSLSILKRLLAAGANPNQAATIKHISPLALALQSSNDEFARCLLFSGADCRVATMEKESLLHVVAGAGKSSLLNLFVARGLSLEERNRHGMLPIHIAANEGEIETVKAIHALQPRALNATIDTTEEVSLHGATPLHMAAQGNESMMTQFLLQKYVDLEARTKLDQTAFSIAAGSATKAVIELFSPYKLSKDPKVLCSALTQAVARDNIDVVIDLYLRGVPIDAEIVQGFTGIQWASFHGSLQTTQWLLQHSADPFYPCSTGEDSFQLAAHNKSAAQFGLLLEYAEPDLDELRNNKETLLHTAAKAGRINHVVYLIKNFVSLNIQDAKGHLPVHAAVQNGRHSIVNLLLACGADHRSRALTDFLAEDDEIMRKTLMDATAWLESGSREDTPLHTAVRSGNLLAVLLMTCTEDVNQKNSRGETPLDLAKKLGNQEACRYLINAGAEINI